MTLSEELAWRGLIKDKTFSDLSWLDKPQTFYHGVDASSSDSMQIGNLAAMLFARRLIDAGWKAVLLAGGATSLIGDPKETEERELKPHEEIEKNVAAIKGQINRLFAGQQFTPVDNYDWLKDVGYLDFLREVGKNFAMNELMQREFVTDRLNSGISYAEFSYSLIQGYDYLQLYKNHGVVLQIGGSDQWGNMLSGVGLVRKKTGKDVQAVSMPLVIDKATGRKFGKSEGGAIWLDPAKTSPNDFYQFWVNVGDEDVEDYLKIFTLLPKEDVEQTMAEFGGNHAGRAAQKRLAREVTKLVHGDDAAATAEAYAEKLKSSTAEATSTSVSVAADASIVDTLVSCNLASSKTEARQLLADGGVYINDQQTKKENFEPADFHDGLLKLRRGKALQNTVIIKLL